MSTTNDGSCHRQTAGFGHQPDDDTPFPHRTGFGFTSTPASRDRARINDAVADLTIKTALARMSEEEQVAVLTLLALARMAKLYIALNMLGDSFVLTLAKVWLITEGGADSP